MPAATLIRHIPQLPQNLVQQSLFWLPFSISFTDNRGLDQQTPYIVVSASKVMPGGVTEIFPANRWGTILSWEELYSQKGFNQVRALQHFGAAFASNYDFRRK